MERHQHDRAIDRAEPVRRVLGHDDDRFSALVRFSSVSLPPVSSVAEPSIT